jgi:hypothetical protein
MITEKVLNEIRSNLLTDYHRTAEYSVIEFCGVQRHGKTTLMVAFLCEVMMGDGYVFDYKPHEVHANFNLYIPGVHCWNNEDMLQILLVARKEKWTHLVFLIDECSQPPLFYARNSKDKVQTELTTALWQFPKCGNCCCYSDNPGNSVDVQMRDATHYTIIPYKYHRDGKNGDTVEYAVVDSFNQRTSVGNVMGGLEKYQKLFDSWKPVV